MRVERNENKIIKLIANVLIKKVEVKWREDNKREAIMEKQY